MAEFPIFILEDLGGVMYASRFFGSTKKSNRQRSNQWVQFHLEGTPPHREPTQAFYYHIVRWRYLSHDNVLPFLGVSKAHPPLGLISPRMPYNIKDYMMKNLNANRLQLVGSSRQYQRRQAHLPHIL